MNEPCCVIQFSGRGRTLGGCGASGIFLHLSRIWPPMAVNFLGKLVLPDEKLLALLVVNGL